MIPRRDEPDPCPTGCQGTGWEVVEVDGVRRARKCTRCDYWPSRRGFAPGVPEDQKAITLASYDGKALEKPAGLEAALKQAQFFVDGVHPGLFLHGPVGCGKTTLAVAILNTLHGKGQRVRFWRVPELLVKLQPNMEAEGTDLLDGVITVPVLALDDVGANQGTDFARRMLQTIYDARQDRGHRTIWTSNLTLDELGTFLGDDRLPSRIAGAAKLVELEGPDYRLKQAKKRLKGK